MKRLVQKAKFYDGFKANKDYIELFINPNSKEIQDVKEVYNGSVRGVIDSNDDMIIWTGNYLHDDINSNATKPVDIDGFRFAWEPGKGWLIDGHLELDTLQCEQMIKKNLNRLRQIGDINSPFEILLAVDQSLDGDKYLYYPLQDKSAKTYKYLQKQAIMNLEMFQGTLDQLGDKGRDILKGIEDYKFELEQAARILKNDQTLTQKIVQKRKMLDQAAGQIYSIVFDIENIDIVNAYEQQQMSINTPPIMDQQTPPEQPVGTQEETSPVERPAAPAPAPTEPEPDQEEIDENTDELLNDAENEEKEETK